jgi:alpha-galactosidase
MKQRFLTCAAVLLAFCTLSARNIHVSTPNTSLVIAANEGADAQFLYYGHRLTDADLKLYESNGDAPATLGAIAPALPVYGMQCQTEEALAVTHADGNMTLQTAVVSASTQEDADATTAVIELKDKVYPFTVRLYYKAYKTVDVIETWTEVEHAEKKAVSLRRFDSGYLPIRRGNVWVSHLYGSWGNEARLVQEPLEPGLLVIKNKDGVRNTHCEHPEVMISLDGQPAENSGRVIGAALCYSGNYYLRLETHDDEYHHFFAGIHPDNSTYTLAKGEVFRTPALALTYSEEGLSGSSRNFHRWARSYKLAHGHDLRRILLNSWEGVYFDVNQEGMDQMMGDIASMGGELFVMDDGWFGDKYPRKNDSSSLGDWVVDKNKLPNGIQGLLDDAKKHGVKFGIWIEPEMANTTSELYERHPEWIVKAPGRDAIQGRGGTQVVLDLSNPAVQDYVYSIVDNLMTQYPDIAYIKWDANMSILNHGSQYLTMDRQSHLYIAYHRGLESVCQRIRNKYPDLVIQACASGGGRANYGLLPYFDEFWVSDNTDALQRIYMQWGTSYFYPANAMACHISASPNHQTHRIVPLKYRIDVAMSGRLGIEIQPKNMTDDEKALCRQAISEYKQIRPIVQQGDIYRLLSPYDHQGVASLMYVTPEKDQAVFYWWRLEQFLNNHFPMVKMAGLDPSKQYRIHELNRIDNEPLAVEGQTFSGAYLMANGLDLPTGHNVDWEKQTDYASRVLWLEEVK